MAQAKDVETVKRPYEILSAELLQRAEIETAVGGTGDAFTIAARVVDDIMSAETDDDVYDANEGGGADIEDYLNMPFIVNGIEFRQSEERFRKGGLGVYVGFDAIFDSGETVRFNIGAPNVVASLTKLEKLGYIGKNEDGTDKNYRTRIVGKVTPNGTLYRLARA